MNINGMNLALTEITGSKNVLVEDDLGIPSTMVKIPRFNLSDVISGGPETPHPMFIVDGVVKDSIYVGKFLSTVWNQRAYSLPGRDPSVNMTLEDAKKYAYNKGEGWHVMSNAERAGIALWCKANGYFPYGNTNGGKNYSKPFYRGTSSIKTNSGTYSAGDVAKTANAGTDDFIEFNKSNATSLTIDSYEGASTNGTTFVGGKTSCTIDASTADNIEKIEYYINKRSDSVVDSLTLMNGVNGTSVYNSLNNNTPCVLKDAGIYKMWFCGQDSSSKTRVLYCESVDLINWGTPVLVLDLTASSLCAQQLWRPCVIKVSGVFRMYVTGNDSSGTSRALQCTSSDGIHWNTPTLAVDVNTATGSKTAGVGESWVIQETDGSFTMWFVGTASTRLKRLFRTTSTDGSTWGTPTMVLDCSMTSDGSTYYGIHEFSIAKDGSTYKLWCLYTDSTGNNIMYRESSDGITWGTASVSLAMLAPISLNVIADGYTTPTIFVDSGVYHLFLSGHNNSDGKNRIYKVALSDKKTVPLLTTNLDITSNSLITSGAGMSFVMKDGTTYKMWYTGNSGSGLKILYSESSDGVTWASPIVAVPAGGSTYSAGNVSWPTVVKESATSYKMWFEGIDSSNVERILYCTSTDGKTWGTPVLAMNIGTNASGYNSTFCATPNVIKESDTSYKMWFSGYDGTNYRILYSTSTDGITWTAPVLAINIGSDTKGYTTSRAASPFVVKNSDGTYRMWLQMIGTTSRIGYCTSTDGLTWSDITIAHDNTGSTNEIQLLGASVLYDTTSALWKMWVTSLDASTTQRILYITSPLPNQFSTVPAVDVTTTAINANNSQQPWLLYDTSDSKYKLWFGVADNSYCRIAYSESLDLLTWTTPMTTMDVKLTVNGYSGVSAPCVIKESSGTFKMWFEGQDASGVWRIQYCTSTDGKHWTTPTTVVDKGLTTTIYEPKVIKLSDGTYSLWYRQFVSGTSSNGSIYRASSTDGITWSNHTLCKNLIVSGAIGQFNVYLIDNKYHMFSSDLSSIYHQYSIDGVNWQKDTVSKQTFIPSGLSTYTVGAGTGSMCLLPVNGRYLLIIGGANSAGVTRLSYGYTPYLTQSNRIRTTASDGTIRTKRIENSIMVMSRGASVFASSYIERPCIIKESDTSYKMWLSMSDGTNWRVGYSTSTDGKTWTAPVVAIDINNTTYNVGHSAAPWVIKESDTSYKMWFCGADIGYLHFRILYATSTDGISWSAPVLNMDIGTSTYSSSHAYQPCIIKESDTSYKMWLSVYDGTGTWRVGYSTSTDGKTWTAPVVAIDCAVGSFNIAETSGCMVIKESNTSYKMWFCGRTGTNFKILYSTSSDGKTWSTPTIAIDTSTSIYNESSVTCPMLMKESSTKYRMWYVGRDVNLYEYLLYSESADGVTNWTTDVTDPILLKNMTYTVSQNSADGYINTNITSIQPAYASNAVFNYQPSTSIQRLQMRNTKKVHFEIRSASSTDGKTPSNLLTGDFTTNGDIQDIFLQVNSRTSDSSVSIYSKSGSALIAKVTPTEISYAGDDGVANDDGIIVTNPVNMTTGDIIDSQAKITLTEVYGDIDIVRTLTGTCGTGHDGTPDGIMDVTGNVWEMLTGLKLVAGQFQVTPNNDSAEQFYSDDDCLQAIDQSGNLVDPASSGTLFVDGATGATKINTKVTTVVGDSGAYTPFVSLGVTAGVTVPVLLKTLGLFPADSNDHGDSIFRYKNIGTGYPIFGGDANSQMANGGPFTLSFMMGEGLVSPSVGFRVCYYEP